MSMLLTCSNKGCYHSDYHRLDEGTGDVLCSKCSQPINVSEYAKRALKNMKQIVKKVKSDLEVTCPSCKATDSPALKKYGKRVTKVVCKQCGVINAHLSRYFVEALKMKDGIKVLQATPEEIAALNNKGAPQKFHETKSTTNLEEPTSRDKLEYYQSETGSPKLDGDQSSKASDTTNLVNDGNVEETLPKTSGENVNSKTTTSQAKPQADQMARLQFADVSGSDERPSFKFNAKKEPDESRIRKSAENMPAIVTTHQHEVPPTLKQNGLDTISGDILVRTGLTDYIPDADELEPEEQKPSAPEGIFRRVESDE